MHINFQQIELIDRLKPRTQIYLQKNCKLHKSATTNSNFEQDAREAMRVVFSVHTKRICMHKTKFIMNIFKYCFKNYIKLYEFANCNSAKYDV